MSTALAWAKRLGLVYRTRKKSYYVDGHDRKDVLGHRNNEYLPAEKALELRQYLWAQLSVAEFDDLKIETAVGALRAKELLYDLSGGRVEVHIDLLPTAWRELPRFSTVLENGVMVGGRLSERFPQGETPVIKVGGDETSWCCTRSPAFQPTMKMCQTVQ